MVEVEIKQAAECLRTGEVEAARELSENLLKSHPSHAAVLNLAGVVRRTQREFESARELFLRSLSEDDSSAKAWCNLGLTEFVLEAARGDGLAGVLTRFDEALKRDSGLWEAALYRAVVLKAMGRYKRAEKELRALVAREPHVSEGWVNLAELCLYRADGPGAMSMVIRAMEGSTRPDSDRRLQAVLKKYPEEVLPECRPLVEKLLRDPELDPQSVAPAGWNILLRDNRIGGVLRGFADDPKPDDWLGGIQQLDADGLLSTLLENSLITDPVLERAITNVRCQILLDRLEDEVPGLIAALSCQQELNEGTLWISQIEEDALSRLPGSSAMHAAYRDVHDRSETGVDAVQDDLSSTQRVRNQYEEWPYPRWKRLTRPLRTPLKDVMAGKFPWADFSRIHELPRILVAGCGTGRHAIQTALSYENRGVVAIDLSEASLEYARQKSEEVRCSDINFRCADLMDIPPRGEQFDLIESVGVLHHLSDAVSGWRVLRDSLAPHGVMRIGLYSARARKDIDGARCLVADLSPEKNPDSATLRAARRRVHTEMSESSVLAVSDFYSLSGCRDLLFHAQEKAFTLEQISELLAVLELEFLGFEFEDDEASAVYGGLFPEDSAMTDLAHWSVVEEEFPQTFLSMYTFWCRRRI